MAGGIIASLHLVPLCDCNINAAYPKAVDTLISQSFTCAPGAVSFDISSATDRNSIIFNLETKVISCQDVLKHS